MTKQNNDAHLFLRSLKEEGIDDVYLTPRVSIPQKVQPASSGKSIESGLSAKDELLKIRDQVAQCQLCTDLASHRKNTVFGSGNIKAKLMLIGEAPGREEDDQGLPFVGAAGQLLTKIIESIGLTRQKVFIANTLKCRPPENRPPQPDEIENCNPFLKRQIELIQPKIICGLGAFAAQTLLRTTSSISQLRGGFHAFPGDPTIKVMCTYHPAYLLRNPDDKKKVWEDMKMIKKELDEIGKP